MDIMEASKKAINKALDEKWKIHRLESSGNNHAIYTLTSSWGFKAIRITPEYAIFETFWAGSEVDGNFGELYMRVKAEYGGRLTENAVKSNVKALGWIKRTFL